MFTGSTKLRACPADVCKNLDHGRSLDFLAGTGLGWAQEALTTESSLWFISASGYALLPRSRRRHPPSHLLDRKQ